jgi:hypothetical protein
LFFSALNERRRERGKMKGRGREELQQEKESSVLVLLVHLGKKKKSKERRKEQSRKVLVFDDWSSLCPSQERAGQLYWFVVEGRNGPATTTRVFQTSEIRVGIGK